MLSHRAVMKYLILIVWCLVQVAAKAGGLFTPPEAPLVSAPGEQLHSLVLPAGPVDAAQRLIDAARQAQPTAHLILKASGPLTVQGNPLRLGSRMSLRLSPGAGIAADRTATAACLIVIDKAEFVSIASAGYGAARLDGGGKVAVGIKASDAIRINVDQLEVVGCNQTAIALRGRDATKVNEACSVTRCHLHDNGSGLRVEQSAAFMCLDNEFAKHSGTALVINSLCSVVAGNAFRENKTAIQCGSDRGVIARNVIDDASALELTPESAGVLVSENRSTLRDLRLLLAGKDHQLFRNRLAGSATLAPNSGEMLLLANAGLKPPPAAPKLKFFNPPTVGNTNRDAVIIPGMERFDLTVPGGKQPATETLDAATGKKKVVKGKAVPVDLAQVQSAVDQARAAHPNAVLVLSLEGEYVARSPKGLALPPNTCVLLQGRIKSDFGGPVEPLHVKDAPLSQVVTMPASGFGSFSGGILDANRQAFHPLNAGTKSTALIDGVELIAGARDGVYVKGRGANEPLFIYRCTVAENLGRGIWSHVASRVHSIANTVAANRMDGIDLDAYSKNGTALFNVSNGNHRHGVFVEEAITHHIVFGNTLSGNGNSGVHVWNEEVKGNTGQNVVAANVCEANNRGVSVGGRADDKTANENLLFNNVCRANRTEGVRAGNAKARNNYFSQCVVEDKADLVIPESAQSSVFNDVR